MSVTVRTTFVRYVAGSRYTRTSAYTDIHPPVTNEVDGCYTIPFIPETLTFSDVPYRFAFLSVTGSAEGNSIQTNRDYCIPVGSAPINAMVVYVPADGGGHDPGEVLLVDAFLVDEGRFSNLDFIDVLTGGIQDAALTSRANEWGRVPNNRADLMLRAYTNVESAPFGFWMKAGATVRRNEREYPVAQGEGGLSIAFFAKKEVVLPKVDIPISAWLFVSDSVMKGNIGFVWGPKGPVPVDGWRNGLMRLAARLATLGRSNVQPSATGRVAAAFGAIANNLRRSRP